MESLLLSLLEKDGRMSMVLLAIAVVHLYKRSLDCEKKHEAAEEKYDVLLRKLAMKGCIQKDCSRNNAGNDRSPPSAGAIVTMHPRRGV